MERRDGRKGARTVEEDMEKGRTTIKRERKGRKLRGMSGKEGAGE